MIKRAYNLSLDDDIDRVQQLKKQRYIKSEATDRHSAFYHTCYY